MADETPITPEQALIAVKAAGLDPDQPLSEQLATAHPDEQTVGTWAREAVTDALNERQGDAADPGAFAQSFLDALNRSTTRWMGEENDGA